MPLKKTIFSLILVLSAISVFAEEYLPAKVFLVNGKNYECKVSGGDGRIKIRRTLSSGMVATESYRIDKIKSLYLPEPDFLKTNLNVSTVAKLSSAVRIAAAVYKKYKPFIDIKGKTWAAEIGLKSAKLYEQAKNYKKAHSLYKKLAKNRKNEEIKNALLLRIGVCTFKLGNYYFKSV